MASKDRKEEEKAAVAQSPSRAWPKWPRGLQPCSISSVFCNFLKVLMTKPRRGPSGQHSRSRLQRAHRQTMSRLTRAGSSPLCIHPHRGRTKSMKYVIFTSTGVGDFVIISANILGENTEVPNVRLQLFLLAGLWSDSFLIGGCWDHSTHGTECHFVLICSLPCLFVLYCA